MTIKLKLLGPVEGFVDGSPLALGGSKQKSCLALLIIAGERSVSTEHLLEGVWGDDPPNGATATLRVFISNLRKAVSPNDANGIRFDGSGYSCSFACDVDLFEFEEISRRASTAPASSAARLWRQALARFSGDPLGGLEFTEPIRHEQVRLTEARLAAQDALFTAELQCGRHQEVIPEMLAATEQEPFRERLRGALILALYRSGRQAEALRSYQAFRERLVDELGIEPCQELRDLERKILEQSPELLTASSSARSPSTIDVRGASHMNGRVELSSGRTIELSRRITVIGRDESSDIAIDDRRVSRQHAVIRSRDGQYEIMDDGSTNGTEVNGQAVDQHDLQSGDIISLGGFEMTFVQ